MQASDSSTPVDAIAYIIGIVEECGKMLRINSGASRRGRVKQIIYGLAGKWQRATAGEKAMVTVIPRHAATSGSAQNARVPACCGPRLGSKVYRDCDPVTA